MPHINLGELAASVSGIAFGSRNPSSDRPPRIICLQPTLVTKAPKSPKTKVDTVQKTVTHGCGARTQTVFQTSEDLFIVDGPPDGVPWPRQTAAVLYCGCSPSADHCSGGAG